MGTHAVTHAARCSAGTGMSKVAFHPPGALFLWLLTIQWSGSSFLIVKELAFKRECSKRTSPNVQESMKSLSASQ